MLREFAQTAARIASTTKKLEKERYLGEYLRSLDDPSLERAVVFFTGSPFPRKDERVAGVGWATISDAVSEATGASHADIAAAARSHGDLGDGIAELFPPSPPDDPSIVELGETFDALAATSGAKNKTAELVKLYKRLGSDEARFVSKILLGEFRIGLQQGLVESAIAKAFGRSLDAVRRAQMFTGDLGTAAMLARANALDQATMTLFHPIEFMLAQAEENPEKIIEQLGSGALADDKYDGIRAQVHAEGGEVRIYSRTLDEVSARFPEVAEAARSLSAGVILDGELVACRERILPFAVIQTRLGRRKITEQLLAGTPVVFFAFDLLYFRGAPMFDKPLHERLDAMRSVVPLEGAVRLGDQRTVVRGSDVDEAFDAARERANEGLVVKDPDSLYMPGRRGKAWLKYKKALATLDCVVTAAEYGHGKRRNVLSDYTFAIRVDGELMNIGKAYSGLTQIEIDQLTEHFKKTTIARYGPVHVVEPAIVLEIAFDRIQESTRHKSGYALRFPRIVRIRDDKTVDQISTIDEARRIHEGQMAREKGA
ncbi:MAG TPA: ATP-dependent DNA ligase [Thermoanaerobaculia bacterium]